MTWPFPHRLAASSTSGISLCSTDQLFVREKRKQKTVEIPAQLPFRPNLSACPDQNREISRPPAQQVEEALPMAKRVGK
jgi:hypothetical protein